MIWLFARGACASMHTWVHTALLQPRPSVLTCINTNQPNQGGTSEWKLTDRCSNSFIHSPTHSCLGNGTFVAMAETAAVCDHSLACSRISCCCGNCDGQHSHRICYLYMYTDTTTGTTRTAAPYGTPFYCQPPSSQKRKCTIMTAWFY